MRRLFGFLIVGCLLLCPVSLFAQRQTNGRPSVDAFMSFSTLTGDRFGLAGGGANWNMYRYASRVSWGVDVSALSLGVNLHADAQYDNTGTMIFPEENHSYEHLAYDITAGGGYHLRLLAPRSRVVILSAGVNGYAGVRYCSELSRYLKSDFDSTVTKGSSSDESLSKTAFVLNFVPEVLFEAFPFRNFSVAVSLRPRMNVIYSGKGDCDWLKLYLGFGAKYYL